MKKTSRRSFLYNAALASLATGFTNNLLAKNIKQEKPNSLFNGVQVGAITYSFRSLPGEPEKLVQYCINANISAIELMGDSIEDYAGKPVNTFKPQPRVPGQPQQPLSDEDKAKIAAYQKAVADWRATVAMDKFEEVRKMFNNAGIHIYAFKPNALNASNTDAEIEYALKAAKTLGATSVTVELPTDAAHSLRLGKLAEKHKVYIGYHAHLQATDTAWDTALSQSQYNSMNLDCGHYIAAGEKNTKETLLALIQAKHDRITSLHIKDRKTKLNGGQNVEWGQGDTPIKEILLLLRDKKYKIPATIELEYNIPKDSDAVKETHKCMEFAKNILQN